MGANQTPVQFRSSAPIRKTLRASGFLMSSFRRSSRQLNIMAHLISFKVQGDPVGKGRPRITTRGNMVRSYTPEKTRDYECLVADIAHREMMNAGLLPTYDAVRVEFEFYFAIPKSYSKKKHQQCVEDEIKPMIKPDIDNAIKACLDAMNKTVYIDDKQVVECLASKHYTEDDEGFVKVAVYVL